MNVISPNLNLKSASGGDVAHPSRTRIDLANTREPNSSNRHYSSTDEYLPPVPDMFWRGYSSIVHIFTPWFSEGIRPTDEKLPHVSEGHSSVDEYSSHALGRVFVQVRILAPSFQETASVAPAQSSLRQASTDIFRNYCTRITAFLEKKSKILSTFDNN